ncbi:MAG: peptidase, partial [Proteobacteria bacterium]
LFERAVAVRGEIAKLLGFANWADYKTASKMAGNAKAVNDFLDGLKGKLSSRNRADLDNLLKFKKELDPSAKTLDPWDTAYLSNQLQKRDYNIDQEKIREYFPADLVIDGMFKIYSKMLGVRFEEVKDAKVWAKDVHLYAVYDQKGTSPIAYFHTDFFPRPGKYGHAAAFPLRSGRRLSDGSYLPPVTSIVSNFTAPADGKPSLLTHDEVSTAFHEFGHIMHMTLTKAAYASLSGASVRWDFVEAPSQMLENWVWSPQILDLVSGHYLDHAKKLPKAMFKQMLLARDFNQGMAYTRQLLFAIFDMTVHTQQGSVELLSTYDRLYREIAGLEPMAGNRTPGTVGHFMGGYDAGYYGYLWSEVFAQDMFSKFNQKDLTSNKIGGRYRRAVLEQGGMKEPGELLREFLGREPRNDAFLKRLGIK